MAKTFGNPCIVEFSFWCVNKLRDSGSSDRGSALLELSVVIELGGSISYIHNFITANIMNFLFQRKYGADCVTCYNFVKNIFDLTFISCNFD